MLSAEQVGLDYATATALDGVDLVIGPGERVALMGSSGSGKSSLVHCLAGVLTPTRGRVRFDDGSRRVDLTALGERERSRLRLERFGVVFQFGDLIPELTLLENVALPLRLLGRGAREADAAAVELMRRLGVADVADRRAGTVSGGQAQRAAVARALVHRPAVVLADEPTGALDSVSAEQVLDALTELTADVGAALLVVTHDHQVAAHLDRLVVMRDGRLSEPVPSR